MTHNTAGLCHSSSLTSMPKKGKEHEPGLVGVTLAKGSITCPPVSVCQKVSTIWHLPLPTWGNRWPQRCQRQG